jgi:hypothetical protein
LELVVAQCVGEGLVGQWGGGEEAERGEGEHSGFLVQVFLT